MAPRGGIVAALLAAAIAVSATAVAAPARPVEVHAAAHWCGSVHGDSERPGKYRVSVDQGRIACHHARRVIRYVLHHGKVTQGSVGRSPRGWSCGWGYGEYHHDPAQYGRSGPICTRHSVTVEGYGRGWYPSPSEKPATPTDALHASAARHCRPVRANGPGETHIRARHVSCRVARRLARACGGGNCTRFGFTCRWRGIGVDAAETHCKRGRARVYWQNRA